jgi:hypothetical protein
LGTVPTLKREKEILFKFVGKEREKCESEMN